MTTTSTTSNTTPREGANDKNQSAVSGVIADILDALNNTIFAGMVADHDEDQREVNQMFGAVGDCLTDLQTANETQVQRSKQLAKGKAAADSQCAGERDVLNSTLDTVCEDAHLHFETQLTNMECTLGIEEEAPVLKKHLDCVEDFTDRIPPGEIEYWKCNNATQQFEDKSVQCAKKKASHHSAYCVFEAIANLSCSTYAGCYASAKHRYQATRMSVKAVEEGRKAEALMLARIHCYLSLIALPAWQLHGSDGAARLQGCAQLSDAPEAGQLNITYPHTPPATHCNLVGQSPGSFAPAGGCPSVSLPDNVAYCDAFQCPVHYELAPDADEILGHTKEICCRVRVSVAAGNRHSAFVDSGGSVRMVGQNNYGQLGEAQTQDQFTRPVRPTGVSGVAQVACLRRHTVFLLQDGTVMAAGKNDNWQLGDGTTDVRTVPVKVVDLDSVVDVAVGPSARHTVFVKADGTVWGTGSKAQGQLGDVSNVDPTKPWQIQGFAGARVKQAAVGSASTVFLMADGTVMGLGANTNGELGIGSTDKQTVPAKMPGIANAIQVAMGAWHTYILLGDGTVRAMGQNTAGQLGDGTQEDKNSPVTVQQLHNVVSVAAMGYGGLFQLGDGKIMGVGYNQNGELVDGAHPQTVPVQLVGLQNVTQIAGGTHHALFLMSDGTVRSAGLNENGALGDGTLTATSSSAPTTVKAAGKSNAPLNLF
mmetsp:Transcript_88413/g.274860  ORF Transcript_88413/g.274860 Transcript_88413/m.274860 type:complete len:706 (-) Transcript_88413:26-2143(-)